MEHTQAHHHNKRRSHKLKTGTITRVITVVAFVLLIAVMVFYLNNRDVKTEQPRQIFNRQIEKLDLSAPKENLAGEVDEKAKPETIDIGMIENDLIQTDKNLETIDSLSNI